jgi:hypothetical protein
MHDRQQAPEIVKRILQKTTRIVQRSFTECLSKVLRIEQLTRESTDDLSDETIVMLTNALIHRDRHRSHPASQPSKANGQGEPGSGELGLRRARPTVGLVASRSPRPLPDVVVAGCARVHGSTRSRPEASPQIPTSNRVISISCS